MSSECVPQGRGRPTRRALLAGAIAAGAGLAAGRLSEPETVTAFGKPHLPGSSIPRSRLIEAHASAAPGAADLRLGSHRMTWSVATTAPMASVTFDDGPDPAFTPRVLAALDKAGVKATFMVMGWNAARHPDLLKDVVAAGHEIGNHTWSHEDLAFQTAEQTREQIVRAKDTIEDIVQVPLVGFRPPRGELNGAALAVCAELGYDLWLWSVTRGPTDPGVPQDVVDWVGDHTQAGDIVDLHDSIGWHVRDRSTAFAHGLIERREVEIKALPDMLAKIGGRGISLVPMGTLATHAIAP